MENVNPSGRQQKSPDTLNRLLKKGDLKKGNRHLALRIIQVVF